MAYEVIDNGDNPSTNRFYIRRVADGAIIPIDESNRDFQEFLRWNAEQETPLVYTAE